MKGKEASSQNEKNKISSHFVRLKPSSPETAPKAQANVKSAVAPKNPKKRQAPDEKEEQAENRRKRARKESSEEKDEEEEEEDDVGDPMIVSTENEKGHQEKVDGRLDVEELSADLLTTPSAPTPKDQPQSAAEAPDAADVDAPIIADKEENRTFVHRAPTPKLKASDYFHNKQAQRPLAPGRYLVPMWPFRLIRTILPIVDRSREPNMLPFELVVTNIDGTSHYRFPGSDKCDLDAARAIFESANDSVVVPWKQPQNPKTSTSSRTLDGTKVYFKNSDPNGLFSLGTIVNITEEGRRFEIKLERVPRSFSVDADETCEGPTE